MTTGHKRPRKKDYLNSIDTGERPMSILMLLTTFLLVSAGILILFIGARWVYGSMNHDDVADTSPGETLSVTSNESSEDDSENSTTTQSDSDESSTTTVESEIDLENETNGPEAVQDSQENISEVSNDSASTAANEPIPDTGPGKLVGLFIIATITGTIVYRQLLLKMKLQ